MKLLQKTIVIPCTTKTEEFVQHLFKSDIDLTRFSFTRNYLLVVQELSREKYISSYGYFVTLYAEMDNKLHFLTDKTVFTQYSYLSYLFDSLQDNNISYEIVNTCSSFYSVDKIYALTNNTFNHSPISIEIPLTASRLAYIKNSDNLYLTNLYAILNTVNATSIVLLPKKNVYTGTNRYMFHIMLAKENMFDSRYLPSIYYDMLVEYIENNEKITYQELDNIRVEQQYDRIHEIALQCNRIFNRYEDNKSLATQKVTEQINYLYERNYVDEDTAEYTTDYVLAAMDYISANEIEEIVYSKKPN